MIRAAEGGGKAADVEKSNTADTVDIEGENSYAIVWDYGRSWDKYISKAYKAAIISVFSACLDFPRQTEKSSTAVFTLRYSIFLV